GRAQPLPSLPRLRASGELLELGTEDVAFTRRESRALLNSLLGVAVSDEQLDRVLARTEGWPAGIRLAGLALRASGQARLTGAASAARDLSEYVEAECLASLTPEERAFLRRTSVLGRLCGPLCDAVLDRTDSSRMLAWLESTNLFLVALDRDREWF